jgi:DNA-binding NarL/FixJ family response regulator
MHALIVDDHPLFSAGLQLLLQQSEAVQHVDCAVDGEQALARVRSHAFDMVLLDWVLGGEPSGEKLIVLLHEIRPRLRVVVIAGECPPARVRSAIEAGAVGFVPKAVTPAEMISALSITARGGIYLPPGVLMEGAAAVSGSAFSNTVGTATSASSVLRAMTEAFPGLTPRQQDVLGGLVIGLSNKAIARELGIAEGTVKQHVHAIYRELGVDSRTEAVYLLARRGVRFV